MPDYGDNYFIKYYVMIVHHECFREILKVKYIYVDLKSNKIAVLSSSC